MLRNRRREFLSTRVTAHRTAKWIARVITEACGWEQWPRYITGDRADVYGNVLDLTQLGNDLLRRKPLTRHAILAPNVTRLSCHSRITPKEALQHRSLAAPSARRTLDAIDPHRMPRLPVGLQ